MTGNDTDEETRSWKTLLETGERIDSLDDLAAGDVAFLAIGGSLVAFSVDRLVRSGNMIRLYMSHTRMYALGGASRVEFQFAIRPMKAA